MFLFLILIWFIVAVACYTLREIPHIWSKSTTYKLRWNAGKWWTDASPRKESWFRNLTGFNMFDDAYHFFGNLPRVLLSILLTVYFGWFFGVLTFLFWWLGREFTLSLIVGKNENIR